MYYTPELLGNMNSILEQAPCKTVLGEGVPESNPSAKIFFSISAFSVRCDHESCGEGGGRGLFHPKFLLLSDSCLTAVANSKLESAAAPAGCPHWSEKVLGVGILAFLPFLVGKRSEFEGKVGICKNL